TTPAIELWAKLGIGAKRRNASARNPDMDNDQRRRRDDSHCPKPNLPVSTISYSISFFLHLHLASNKLRQLPATRERFNSTVGRGRNTRTPLHLEGVESNLLTGR